MSLQAAKISSRSHLKLPQLLALRPQDGLGSVVYQNRWRGKGLPVPTANVATLSSSCYWRVGKVVLAYDTAGKVTAKSYGVFYWKGKRITDEAKEFEKIKGGLKYYWSSTAAPCFPAVPTAPETTTPVV